jgi:hypothetical protein
VENQSIDVNSTTKTESPYILRSKSTLTNDLNVGKQSTAIQSTTKTESPYSLRSKPILAEDSIVENQSIEINLTTKTDSPYILRSKATLTNEFDIGTQSTAIQSTTKTESPYSLRSKPIFADQSNVRKTKGTTISITKSASPSSSRSKSTFAGEFKFDNQSIAPSKLSNWASNTGEYCGVCAPTTIAKIDTPSKIYRIRKRKIKLDNSNQKLLTRNVTTITRHFAPFQVQLNGKIAFAKETAIQNDERKYGFVYAQLKCNQCCFATGYHMVSIGNVQYRNDCVQTNRWWDTDFISSFVALLAHETHTTSIAVIHCQFPEQILEPNSCKPLSRHVNTLVSVLHGSSHFAIMEVDIKCRLITIFDGLFFPLKTWFNHIVSILRKTETIQLSESTAFFPQNSYRANEVTLSVDSKTDNEWTVKRDCFLIQKDAYNCGPLACLKLMKLFQPDSVDWHKMAVPDYRRIVMEKFSNLTKKFDGELVISVPSKFIDREDSSVDMSIESDINNTSKKSCIICQQKMNKKVNKMKVTTLDCCQNKMHIACLYTWMQCNGFCLFCQKTFDNKQQFMEMTVANEELTKNTSDRHVARKAASCKRKIQQELQATKMKQRRLDSLSNVQVGKIVSIKQDWRDVSHARGVVGVVFDVSKSGVGGVQVVTEFGIIKTGIKSGKASIYYIPSERFVLQDDDCIISEKLSEIRTTITKGHFEPSKARRITLQAAHKLLTGYEPIENKCCRCKNGKCTSRCGCCVAKVGCTSKCLCNGNCKNSHND